MNAIAWEHTLSGTALPDRTAHATAAVMRGSCQYQGWRAVITWHLGTPDSHVVWSPYFKSRHSSAARNGR